MTSARKCIFSCNITQDKIGAFTEDKLSKCQYILKIRVACKLKYRHVVLPEKIDETHGYHTLCYKTFCAVNKRYLNKYKSLVSGSQLPDSSLQSESEVFSVNGHGNEDLQSSATSEVKLTYKCLFCNRSRKLRGIRKFHLIKSSNKVIITKVIACANTTEDSDVLSRINAFDTNRIFFYHGPCISKYFRKNTIVPEREETEWQIARRIALSANSQLCSFISENILKRKQSYSLSFLLDYYRDALEKLHLEANLTVESHITKSVLLMKIGNKFGNKVQLLQVHNQKVLGPSKGCIVNDETFTDFENSKILKRAALILRKRILSIQKNPLPSILTMTDLIKGECEIPDDILQFLRIVITGKDLKNSAKIINERKIDSITQDLVHATHHGKMKTSKHITLGMTMKSMTKSRKVIDLLNRYGHCCAYTFLNSLKSEDSEDCDWSINDKMISHAESMITEELFDDAEMIETELHEGDSEFDRMPNHVEDMIDEGMSDDNDADIIYSDLQTKDSALENHADVIDEETIDDNAETTDFELYEED